MNDDTEQVIWPGPARHGLGPLGNQVLEDCPCILLVFTALASPHRKDMAALFSSEIKIIIINQKIILKNPSLGGGVGWLIFGVRRIPEAMSIGV